MTNLDSIFKSKDITLPTKVRLVKAMVFPVVVYGCESWTVKKTERRRIDAFGKCIFSQFQRLEIQDHSSKVLAGMVSPVVIYGCESWTVKKTERRRIDAFACGADRKSVV